MGQLEDNLKLALEAVKYAKQQVKRSGNQTYFKPWRPWQNQKRNEFILGATRGGNYTENVNGSWSRDTTMVSRRKLLFNVLNSGDSAKVKEARVDVFRTQWGEDYFWEGKSKAWFDDLRTPELIAKRTGLPLNEVQDILATGNINELMNLFNTANKAYKATKFGMGNCQEKAEIACMYIMNRTPGGVHLALYCLEEAHGGVTGSPGDHVFGIYGLDTVTNKMSTLGPNAVVVDGWMNDAYPAKEHLAWKHGYNYNDERINIKQMTVRNMVCISYKAHVECMRDFGVLPVGPGSLPQETLKRKKF